MEEKQRQRVYFVDILTQISKVKRDEIKGRFQALFFPQYAGMSFLCTQKAHPPSPEYTPPQARSKIFR